MISECRDRGWVRAHPHPEILSVLTQALPSGRVVDDIAERQVDPQAWTEPIVRLVDLLLFD